MEFHNSTDVYTSFLKILPAKQKRRPTWRQFYKAYLMEEGMEEQGLPNLRALLESIWYDQKKEYVNVWPAMFDLVNKVEMKVQPGAVMHKNKVFYVRMPVGHEPFEVKGRPLRSFKFMIMQIFPEKVRHPNHNKPMLMISVDTNEPDPSLDVPADANFTMSYNMTLVLLEHKPMQAALDSITPTGDNLAKEQWQTIAKFALVIAMTKDHPVLFQPHILDKHRQDYANAVKTNDTIKMRFFEALSQPDDSTGYNMGQDIDPSRNPKLEYTLVHGLYPVLGLHYTA